MRLHALNRRRDTHFPQPRFESCSDSPGEYSGRERESGYAKNRLATVFFYLNNVSKGGETNFPMAATPERPNGGHSPRDYFDCSKGVSVFPEEGKVIIFYSLNPDGTQDDYSLHGGCDVLEVSETKWSANFWLWNKAYHFLSPARKRFTAELEATWL